MNKPRYEYSCANDGASVTKKPVAMIVGKKGAEFVGLHGWRCSQCGPGAKVTRRMA